MENKLKIIPLGGLEEVGKNMTLFEYNKKILIVDMGFQFPSLNMPGIDFIVPNTSYLRGKEENIVGIIFTHGHYDHIGAIPYIIGKLGNPPLFATPLTKGIIEKRQEDFTGLAPLKFKKITQEEKFSLHPFKIQAFAQNHNIPEGVGFLIETPAGNVMHTGDFKFDYTPIADKPTDISKIAQSASKGVDVLMSDSTDADNEGHSLSEKTIQENLEKIFEKVEGRIIVATFASLLSRIQELINLAEKFGKKILIDGYSMKSNVEIAINLGYIKVKNGTIISPKEIKKLPDKKILIICTGSQGEGNASLMKLSHREHKFLSIKKCDSVILSSSIIPGNERAIQELKDLLSWQGAKIFHYQMIDIHASGHAYQEELKTMISVTKPKFFMPIHGSHYMLEMHKELAMSLGIQEKNIIVGRNGAIIELAENKISVQKEIVPSGNVMVDGLGIGDVGEVVLRDRQAMSEDGMFVVVVLVDSSNGKVRQSPDIISRGFVYLRESKGLLKETRKRIVSVTESITMSKHPTNWSFVKNRIREDLGEFLFKKTKRRPMVLPVVIEV